MKTVIDFDRKRAYVQTESVFDAGWLGFNFANQHRGLVGDGWLIYFYDVDDDLRFRSSAAAIEVDDAPALARAIEAGSPKTCCHDCCCRKDA